MDAENVPFRLKGRLFGLKSRFLGPQNIASFSAKSSHHSRRSFSLKKINKPKPIPQRKMDTEKVSFRLKKSRLFGLKSRLLGPKE
jgi:hypothetical protein